MNNTITGASAATGASNLDDILGGEPQIESDDGRDESAEETKKADPVKAAEPADEDPEKKVLVPHGAFHEERERRKELQRQLAEEKTRNDRFEERQSKILEALARPASQQEEYVDPLVKLENEVKSVKEAVNKSASQIEADQKKFLEEQRLVTRYKGSIDAFVKDSPDFMDARVYLINDKIRELRALDYNDQEIDQEIRVIERQIVERAYNGEKNPAEVIYKIAKEKGYKKKEADKTIEDIDRGLKASKSLGSGGTVSNETDLKSLSVEDLREMSDEEFNAFFSKIEKQSRRHA